MLDELLDKLNSEAEELLHELNVTLPAHIETAVALGDLKENSEYHAALDRQQFVRARLDHLSRRLSEISKMDLDTIPKNLVGFGSQVELLDLDDKTVERYTIAFGDIIDFEKAEISMASPIGKALLGKAEGDEVNVALPTGTIRYRINSFTTLHDMADKSDG
ncbi:MAG: GreA/GreB family elongation factor [Gemmatimonadota bacterium]